jgi:hypothetical protein
VIGGGVAAATRGDGTGERTTVTASAIGLGAATGAAACVSGGAAACVTGGWAATTGGVASEAGGGATGLASAVGVDAGRVNQ